MILTNLIAQARYFALGDSTSSDYADTDIKRQLNSAYNQLIVLMFSASKEWQSRGNNSQTTDITVGNRQYSLPSTFLRISRVEIKYPSSDDLVRAVAIDYKNINYHGLDKYVTGKPEFDLKGDKIDIFVSAETADIEAVSGGLVIWYENELTELSGASDEPDIPEPYSRLLAQMAAKDYCGVNSMGERYNWLGKEIEKGESSLVEFIANRNEAKKTSIQFRKENYQAGGEYGEQSWNWN